ncbi:phage tail protein [Acinetobacter nosocomialis]|uniref:phage tail protein n=1 Tax=Acinetobacter nosocomialis TaxID=106654 RepID=UPI0029D7C059|nr:phage tail protein [Acinetobacter nosocomialis]MDX7880441.1 phage tail protein [Acinetobacter nosocomialis]
MTIDKLTEFAKLADVNSSNTEGLELEKGFPRLLQPARQWFNWLLNSVTKKINELIDTVNGINDKSDSEIGSVAIYPYSSMPNNRLVCDGKLYNIADYPKLFAKLGTTYGGNGSTTFGVPDYRGVVLRGLDSGRGLDTGRPLGSYQEDSLKAHDHYRNPEGSVEIAVLSQGGTAAGDIQGPVTRIKEFSKTGKTGDIETRMKNTSVIFAIKAK